MADKTISALKIADIAGKIVALLEPLNSETRQKVISGSLTLLGESTKASTAHSGGSTTAKEAASSGEHDANLDGLAAKARRWLKQNGLTLTQIEQVFDIASTGVTVNASELPGKSKREQTHNAYVLQGLASFLVSGEATFTDKDARTICENSGCYDKGNHAKFIGDKGNLLAGSKDSGWKLTAPGFKQAAEIVKQLTQEE